MLTWPCIMQMSVCEGGLALDLEEIGVHLTATGDSFLHELKGVESQNFTKGHFYSLFQHVQKTGTPWTAVKDSLAVMYKEDWSHMSQTALRTSAFSMFVS